MVSRDIPAPADPVSTGWIAINHRVLGTLESSCGNQSLFTRHQNSAPEKPKGQHETVIETFCEIAESALKAQKSGTRAKFLSVRCRATGYA